MIAIRCFEFRFTQIARKKTASADHLFFLYFGDAE